MSLPLGNVWGTIDCSEKKAAFTTWTSADPSGQTFFTRTRNVLYRTINGAANWTVALNTSPTLLRAGSHPIGISP